MLKMRRGSFSVEASLVMPVILGVWVLLIGWCLYLHDRSLLASCAAECAGKGSMQKYQTEQELENWVIGQMYGLAQGSLFTVQELCVSAEVKAAEVTVSYSGKVPVWKGLCVQGTETASRVSPVKQIRSGKQLGEVWKMIGE